MISIVTQLTPKTALCKKHTAGNSAVKNRFGEPTLPQRRGAWVRHLADWKIARRAAGNSAGR
jgi:hypothetical protein